MEWMTNEEFLCYKVLQHLNNNPKDGGVELNEIYKQFQLVKSEALFERIKDALIANGLVKYNGNLTISLLGQEKYNLIHTQIIKNNETSIIDTKIKELTIENYKDKWKLFWRGALVSIIAALIGGLPTIIEKFREPNQQLKIEYQGFPKIIVVHDTVYSVSKDSSKTAK